MGGGIDGSAKSSYNYSGIGATQFHWPLLCWWSVTQRAWHPPPHPTRGSGGASWAPPAGSGAQTQRKTNLMHFDAPRRLLMANSWNFLAQFPVQKLCYLFTFIVIMHPLHCRKNASGITQLRPTISCMKC